MGQFTALGGLLLCALVAAARSIGIATPFETRDVLQPRANDLLDEGLCPVQDSKEMTLTSLSVVYLADCRKYRDKNDDQSKVVQHAGLLLYRDTFDTSRKDMTFGWGAVATPSYPKSQRVEATHTMQFV
ncbi:hypothetical protein DE146DRAFT_635944 [Phaeosphaeria sp. MPI-PUGE-AT-0046c]|nr:hypothetical protein DE146DRAFT_635944 [Phaeosphaeria sp. MPI-PUGE-AT-0046c]